MVTQAGGAISRSIALTLTARDDGSSARVFGRVSRDLEQTQQRLSEVRAEQRRLRSELRGVERGSDAYRELESRIEATRREADRLGDELGEQRRQWSRLTGASERYGTIARNSLLVVGGAVTALLLAVNRVGRQMTEALAIESETGLAVEAFQRLQNQLALVGQELDAGDILEFTTRLGDAQQQAAEGAGAQYEAFQRLGFNVNQLSARDLPRVLEALEAIPDTARRAFESDELLGGSLAERYRLVLALPDDVRQRAEEVQVLTRAQAVEFAVAASEAQAMGRELRNLGSQATSALIPVLEEVLGVLTPIVRTAGALIEANPLLVQGALALGGVLAALTTALWAYNAAQAARLALSGPHGWAILAGAAGLLAAGGIAYAVGRNNLQQSEAAAEAERRFDERFGTQQSQMVQTATQAGSRAGVREGIDDAASDAGNRRLSAILPTAAAAAALDAGGAAPSTPAPFIGPLYQGPIPEFVPAPAGEVFQDLLRREGARLESARGDLPRELRRVQSRIERYEQELGRDLNPNRLTTVQNTLASLRPRAADLERRIAAIDATSPFPDVGTQLSVLESRGADFRPQIGSEYLINVYVQPRADDAEAIRETVRESITAGIDASRGRGTP